MAISLGLISFFSLHIFPYFPMWWIAASTVAIVVLGYWGIQTAIALFIGIFGVSIAYHSAELFLLLILFAWVFLEVAGRRSEFPAETFLLVAGAPCLAASQVFGVALPLEFLVVLLTPVLTNRSSTPVITAVACLWCCLVGIIGNQTLMGNLIIGTPMYAFYDLKPLEAPFYELGWLVSKLDLSLVFSSLKGLQSLGTYFISHPLILLQVLAWASIGYLIAWTLELHFDKNKWWLAAAGVFSAAGMLILLQVIVVSLYPEEVEFNFSRFLWSVGSCGLVLSGMSVFGREAKEEVRPAEPKPSFAIPQATLGRPELSLQDSLKLQSELRKYIQKKFARQITALDIDVVESTRLKAGESPEDAIFSFTEYWKFVDQHVLTEGGRLLNRAGDGAIYIFDNADRAVSATQGILQQLDQFNQATNVLKSPFVIRAGMNSGEIIEDPTQQADVFSRVLDVAGHLQKLAQPSQLLISESTYKQLKSKNRFERQGTSEKDHLSIYALKRQ